MKVRTRFAPSPTGFMHIGNLRSAIFGYLISKHTGGDFILRIEDTDQTREVEGAVEFIIDTCKLCGIEFDEGPIQGGNYGPYIQSERVETYKEHAEMLVEKEKAYYCFCSEERLEELRLIADKKKVAFQYDGKCKNLTKEEISEKLSENIPHVIRQIMPKTGVSTFTDIVYGEISVDNKILEDQILLKSDGFPTYNFANVVDDHLMEITHVMRGNEYLMATPKYNLLYESFGWTQPQYVHLPMVLGEDGLKLSKRNGDASFMDLYNEGYLPEAILNYLVMLGWKPNTTDEVFTKEELINIFDINRIGKAPAVYDVKKLNWYNAQYIKKLTDEELLNITVPHLKDNYDLSDKTEEWINHLVNLYRNTLDYGKQIVELTKNFFESDYVLDEEAKDFMKTEGINETLKVFKQEINNVTEWNIESIKEAINETKDKADVKGKMLFMPLRIASSGHLHGPELPDTIYLIGKDEIMSRLSSY